MRKKLFICMLLFGSFIGMQAQSLPAYLDSSKPIEERVKDALSRMTLEEKIAVIHAQGKFTSAGVRRLGIPDYWTDDGPHGVRAEVLWDAWSAAGQTNDSVVAFPALSCLAATWNPEMSTLFSTNLAEEAIYRNKHMMLAPGINIYRTPLNGRNFEYMGEDPYLTSRMAVPYIKGLQSKGVSACVKHYALNNNEKNRHTTNVIVSDRALNEIYLPGFKAAVTEAGTWAIMGSYNLYKNQHCCHNEYLLMDILKNKWKFDGVVVSDWGGTHDTDQAIKNGLDMEFGTHTDGMSLNVPNAYEKYHLAKVYRDKIQKGELSQKELDDKVSRVLRLFFRSSMNKKPVGYLCSENHYAAANKIASEGIVLLKNDNSILPLNLTSTKKILVVGENAIRMMTPKGGSSKLKAQNESVPLEGLLKRLQGKASIDYARGYVGDKLTPEDRKLTNIPLEDKRPASEILEEAVEKAKNADVVIFFGGLNKNKKQDCEDADRTSYSLPYNQDKVIEAISKVNRNIVFVCISGNAVAMPWIDHVPAVVQGWYLGSEAGNALAAVLTGDTNPSGKLPFTWGKTLDDYAPHKLNAYPGVKRANEEIWDEEYKEGVYVGYRWTDKQKSKPLFAFGHGLSYTTFQLGKVSADKKEITGNEPVTFTVNVKNTGKVAGAEVVQLYIRDVKSSIDRPVKELKGFQKVFLQPGESKDVTLTIHQDALSFYDETSQSWKAEKGDFEALVGNASDHITSKVRFTLK